MCTELKANKFICNGCGKVVKVSIFEDIIRFKKKCADCRLIDITGGLKEVEAKNHKPKNNFASQAKSNTPLRREDNRKKSKNKMTKNQSRKVKNERLGYYA